MTVPPLSVVMSVYNDEEFVGQAIESILAQSFGDFEFLIVDDRSTDRSAAVIAEWAARDKRITVLPSPAKGRVPALNLLFATARAPRAALMDSDDLCDPQRFARQMAFLDSNPDHGAISCNCDFIDRHGNKLQPPPFDRPLTHEGLVANLEDGPLLNHNAVMLSTAAVREVGGYRPLYRHAEDYDLWLRLSQVTRLANLAECLISYRVYEGQVSTRHLAEQTRNAAIAWLVHKARIAGEPDPLRDCTAMPPMDELDTLLGSGAAAYVRRRIVARSLYSPQSLGGSAWHDLLGHIGDVGASPQLWKIVLRFMKAGMPIRAAQCAAALAMGAR